MSTLDKFHTEMVVRNKNYVTDLKYDLELNRILLKIIGVWPTDSRRSTNYDRIIVALAKSVTIFSLLFLMLPIGCYALFVETDWSVKIQVFGTVNYCFEAVVKYAMVIVRKDEIRYCIDIIASGWREADRTVYRSIMLQNARSCRIFTAFYFASSITCIAIYHFVVPFVSDSSRKLQKNRTNLAPILYGTEFFIFNAQVSPMSEVVYLGQTVAAMIMCTVNCAICSLTVKLTMHAWSRYQIVATLMQSADYDGNQDDNDVNRHREKERRFAHILRKHSHAIEFVPQIENALSGICFVCLVLSTINICFLGYTLILHEINLVTLLRQEWENAAPSAIASYTMAMIGTSSNMFVLCYSGEQLAEKCQEVGAAGYMTNWWEMQRNESRALILIIAASQLPIEFTAGKFFNLSLKTFVAVMKISMSYLNFLRTTVQLHE